jgi:hypothetical protein
MLHKALVAVSAAAIMATAFSAVPADARAKKQKQYRPAPPSASISLDGRNTGRARTCWHDSFVYDSRGVPMGPYCH